jgi:hypothetical protein
MRQRISFLVCAFLATSIAAFAAGPTKQKGPGETPPTPKSMIVAEQIVTDNAYDGYTLFAPKNSKLTYLIDNQGNIVNTWKSRYGSGTNAELLSNGHIIRASSVGFDGNLNIHTPFAGGIIEEFDWEGNLVWEFHYNDEKFLQHHFIDIMPNGNVLMLAYDYISKDEAIAAGRDPQKLSDGFLTPEHVVEVKKTGPKSGEIVWEWHVFDHLIQDFDKSKKNFGVVSEHPEKININYCPPGPNPFGSDWNHAANASYNEVTDQVAIAVAGFNEVWIIDHNTTTAEAKGPQGDLIFRFGSPATYDTKGEMKLDGPHNAQILDDGTIAVINYGKMKDKYSSIAFIKPGNGMTNAQSVEYKYSNQKDMFSGFDLLPNGNALLTVVGGILREVTPKGKTVWQYANRDTGNGTLNIGDQIPMIPAIPGGGPGPSFPATYILTAQKYAKDYVTIK